MTLAALGMDGVTDLDDLPADGRFCFPSRPLIDDCLGIEWLDAAFALLDGCGTAVPTVIGPGIICSAAPVGTVPGKKSPLVGG